MSLSEYEKQEQEIDSIQCEVISQIENSASLLRTDTREAHPWWGVDLASTRAEVLTKKDFFLFQSWKLTDRMVI